MKLDEHLIPYEDEISNNNHKGIHNNPRHPHKPFFTRPNRELSWQVANSLFNSFKYAGNGISYAFHSQRNFRIHTVVGFIAILLSLWLNLPNLEIVAICMTISLVLSMELLNTAIESVVDLTVKHSYHELAKIAKDCAAAAVLISALASLLVAGLLILAPLVVKISTILG